MGIGEVELTDTVFRDGCGNRRAGRNWRAGSNAEQSFVATWCHHLLLSSCMVPPTSACCSVMDGRGQTKVWSTEYHMKLTLYNARGYWELSPILHYSINFWIKQRHELAKRLTCSLRSRFFFRTEYLGQDCTCRFGTPSGISSLGFGAKCGRIRAPVDSRPT